MKTIGTIKCWVSKILRGVVPATLIFALWSGSANASALSGSNKADEAKLRRPEKRLVLKTYSSSQTDVVDKAIDTGHSSHSSHASHHSHHSHHSHYSHCSG